jgi:starch phosphorylase
MKLALNGALTIGTLDGANVEIREEVGAEQIFIFGLTAAQVADLRRTGYSPRAYVDADPELRRVLEMIDGGYFPAPDGDGFHAVVESLTHGGDQYMLLADYRPYLETQDRADALYRDEDAWTRCAILNVAGMGRFSSDRAIQEYAERIWHTRPVSR